MNFVWLVLGVCGTALQLVVIYLMIKGFHRKYPWVFFYLLILFLTSVSDFAAVIDPSSWYSWYPPVYYLNNTLRQFSGFFAVVSLYFIATKTHPRRTILRRYVTLGSFLLMILTFGWHSSSWNEIEVYYRLVGRDMSFVTALLNLILWFALVQTRTFDKLLLLVSTGLGLNMAGEAIAQSLNSMDAPKMLVNAISVGSHILCLLIWIKALRLDARTVNSPSRAAIP